MRAIAQDACSSVLGTPWQSKRQALHAQHGTVRATQMSRHSDRKCARAYDGARELFPSSFCCLQATFTEQFLRTLIGTLAHTGAPLCVELDTLMDVDDANTEAYATGDTLLDGVFFVPPIGGDLAPSRSASRARSSVEEDVG